MRVAVIVVSMLVVATPSHASESCMTKTEARQHFGSVHIYWHGSGHCWNATAGRHRSVHRILAHRSQQEKEQQVQREEPQPKWREAMSELLPDDTPVQPREVQTSLQDDEGDTSADGGNKLSVGSNTPADGVSAPAARANWRDRWVDVVQVVPLIAANRPEPVSASPTVERRYEPLVSPRSVILVLLGLMLTVVIIEVLVRSTIYERQR